MNYSRLLILVTALALIAIGCGRKAKEEKQGVGKVASKVSAEDLSKEKAANRSLVSTDIPKPQAEAPKPEPKKKEAATAASKPKAGKKAVAGEPKAAKPKTTAKFDRLVACAAELGGNLVALNAHLEIWKNEGNRRMVEDIEKLIHANQNNQQLIGTAMKNMRSGKTDLDTSDLLSEHDALMQRTSEIIKQKPIVLSKEERKNVLELMARESCLQLERSRGTISYADLNKKRKEIVASANISVSRYEKLRARVNAKPEKMDATEMGMFTMKHCPDLLSPPKVDKKKAGKADTKK